MIRLILILLFAFLYSCNQFKQNYRLETNDGKIFFDQFEDSSLLKKDIQIVDSIEIKYCEELFRKYAWNEPALIGSDFFYILNEMKNTKKSIWTNNIFGSSKIILINHLNSSSEFYVFSLLYFTRNKKYCVLYYESGVAADLAGEITSLGLYENKNG